MQRSHRQFRYMRQSSASRFPRNRLKQIRRPRRPAASSRRAASMARKVLPEPAGPVKSTVLFSAIASRALNCSSTNRTSWFSRAFRRSPATTPTSKLGRRSKAMRLAVDSSGPTPPYEKCAILLSRCAVPALKVRRIARIGSFLRSSESRICHSCHSDDAGRLVLARTAVNQEALITGMDRSSTYCAPGSYGVSASPQLAWAKGPLAVGAWLPRRHTPSSKCM